MDTALEVVAQAAAALVAAASRGLIHRDLKPGNLMLSTSNCSAPGELEVKVSDFGLAKATAAVLGETDLTHGGFVGTPVYASPEQFAGQPLDARSDLYSLGVTLWYALTGKAPFTSRTLEEVSSHPARFALPVEQLAARGVPVCVVALLGRVLAVDAAERPASAKELVLALETCRRQLDAKTAPPANRLRRRAAGVAVLMLAAAGVAWWMYSPTAKKDRAVAALTVASGPVIPEKSIAVLPFENLSADKENAYFTDGVQDEILTDLAKVAELKVIARSSVRQYKADAPRDLRAIAAELGVTHVLTGSVQKPGDQVRVTAQLIDARTAVQQWGES